MKYIFFAAYLVIFFFIFREFYLKNTNMTQTKRGRKPAAQQHAGTGHTCGECASGRWNNENLDYTGSPFLIYCEHGAKGYSKRVQSFVTYKTCEACTCFQFGERKEAIS